jgi:DNA-binding transcriptional ArsR family regulator
MCAMRSGSTIRMMRALPWNSTEPRGRTIGPLFVVAIVKPIGILNQMVLDNSPRLDAVFHALSHPARRAILRQLSSGERNLSELAAPLKMTFPAATKHVRVLEGARLVRRRVEGRQHLCRLEAAPLKDATSWTEQFRRHWEGRFNALDSLLDEMKSEEQSRPRRT